MAAKWFNSLDTNSRTRCNRIFKWYYLFQITVPDWSWLGGGRERTSPLVIFTYSHWTLRFFKTLLVWSEVWALWFVNPKPELDKDFAWLRCRLVLIRWRKGADKSVGHSYYIYTQTWGFSNFHSTKSRIDLESF